MKKTSNGAAKKPATKKTVARKGAASAPASKNMLAAGFKALTTAHEEALARQSRVFESILGLGGKREASPSTDPATPNPLTAALDPFGFRKFEDVFDQRVARSLQNLGVPSLQAMADLAAEVDRLRARIAALEAQAKKR